jgi:anti-anti-sigma regulatory factor
MELSVEVSALEEIPVFVCRGKVVHGPELDYLFSLMTRPDRRDLVLDLQAVTTVDEAGMFMIVLCYELLSASRRRLFLRNPSSDILEGLRRQAQKARDFGDGQGVNAGWAH